MMSTDANDFRKKNKKARQHSKTKGQQQRMSQQLNEQSAKFVKVAESVMELDSIRSITEVNKGGRRVQDKDNLRQQISDEDAKASRLTRVILTPEATLELAKKTKLTNDCTFVGNVTILAWREKIVQMTKQQYWKDMNASAGYQETYGVAKKSFFWIDKGVCTPKELENITSYNKAKVPINKYIKVAKKLALEILGYIKFNDEGGFDDKAVKANDLYFLFMHPSNEVLEEETIEPVEEALVNMCKEVDVHYTYTADKGKLNGSNGDGSDDESDGDDENLDLQDAT